MTRLVLLGLPLLPSLAAAGSVVAAPQNRTCKLTPHDAAWPSNEDWSALNASIAGTLIRTTPAASSCYPGNPFNALTNCTDVTAHWSYAAYHAAWPESVDYSIYTTIRVFRLGLTATTEEQIGIAMKWADERDIRIVVKGTGHDMNGRSTGAYALSIWTHNLNHFRHDPAWRIPGTNSTANVAILGSGNNWGSAYTAVHKISRTLVGGEDATHSLYQVTVITPDGRRLIANDVQNKDLFWAVRGAGGGQFGVVTEFVLATHPVPETVVSGGLTFPVGADHSNLSEASWDALVETARSIPDLMDWGLTGTIMALTGAQSNSLLGLSINGTLPGVAGVISLTGFNTTIAAMNTTVNDLAVRLLTAAGKKVTITPQTLQPVLRRKQLDQQPSARPPRASRHPARRSRHYLRQILTPATGSSGSMALFGLQGGPGTSSVPELRRGSVHPAWRRAYAHLMTYGAPVNASADASMALKNEVDWYEKHIEPVWREWTGVNGGSYANQGNVFSSTWKEDFYGPRNSEIYERLLKIKRKYDPRESLFVWGGVGGDEWDYDLHTGLLCRV
ncbi:hypothetical protein BDW66DRAFT_154851 [Aspergillus desertorum]